MAESTFKDGGLTIFDIDDTLFNTTARVGIVKNGKVSQELTSQQFNSYQLRPREKFDFSQFTDSDKFFKESVPISKMFNKAKAIIRNIEGKPNSRVIIITARTNFQDKNKFLATFKKYGFNIDKVRIERAGRIEGEMIPAFKKAIIIRNYLNTKEFSRVRLFDDSMSNLREFLKLKREFPNVMFEAFFANPDGSVRTIK